MLKCESTFFDSKRLKIAVSLFGEENGMLKTQALLSIDREA